MSPALDTAHDIVGFCFVYFKLFPNSYFDQSVGRDIFLIDTPMQPFVGKVTVHTAPSPHLLCPGCSWLFFLVFFFLVVAW